LGPPACWRPGQMPRLPCYATVSGSRKPHVTTGKRSRPQHYVHSTAAGMYVIYYTTMSNDFIRELNDRLLMKGRTFTGYIKQASS
jgi:hypothetical protein